MKTIDANESIQKLEDVLNQHILPQKAKDAIEEAQIVIKAFIEQVSKTSKNSHNPPSTDKKKL